MENRLTASNAGAALGLCSFVNRQQAFNRAMGVERMLNKELSDAIGCTRVTQGHPLYTFYRVMGKAGSDAPRWGMKHESDGVHAYTIHTGHAVQKAGLLVHPTCSWLAGSPDGLVGTKGLLEVKCPFRFKRDGTRVHETISAAHYIQMHLCLQISGREWCDFVSWTPEAHAIYRVTRDPDLHEAMMLHYERFYAAMRTAQVGPPALSRHEQHDIEERVKQSMAAHVIVNYTV